MSTIQANAVKGAIGIGAGTFTTTQTGTGVAVPVGALHALIVVNCATFNGDETLDLKVQSSDTLGSGYADIAGAAFAQISTANDNAVYVGVVRIHSNAGFLRLVGTQAGTGNCVYSATILFSTLQYAEEGDAFSFNVADIN